MNDISFIVEESPIILKSLREDSPCGWGDITAQQMVEHISLEIAYASKKIVPKSIVSTERMAFWKAKFFNSNMEIPKNFTAKGILEPGQVLPARFEGLPEAKWLYKISVDEFVLYFKKDISRVTFHPFFGYLSYDEWVYYLSRHIKHHFAQFGLMDYKNDKNKDLIF